MSTCFIERLDIHSNHLQYCYHTTVNIGNTNPVVLLHNNIATKNKNKRQFLWQLLPGNKFLSDLENQHKSHVKSVLLASVCYKAECAKVIPERQRKEHFCSIT